MINFVETEMSSNIETELMILDTPVPLIIEHIRSQVERTYGSINYLNTVIDKLDLIEDQYSGDSDTVFKVNEMRGLIFSEVAQIISEFFDVQLNIDYDMPKKTEEIVTDIYEFFIVNIRKTGYRFLLNYIKENKKEIIEVLDLSKPKKDVTTVSVRKKLKNVDVKIISNLYEVVNYIMDLDFQDDVFIEYTRNKSILDLYNQGIISGSIAAEVIQYMKDNRIVYDIVPDLFVKLKGE